MNIHLLFCLLTVITYVLAPVSYSLSFNWSVTLLFIVQFLLFIRRVSQKNYINFYVLFFVSFYFVNYFYPTVIYPIDPEYFSTFRRRFDHNVINSSTSLAAVASSFLMYGASLIQTASKRKQTSYNPLVFNHVYVTTLGLLLLIVFIIVVGREFLSGNFNSQSVASTYILPLVTSTFILSSIIFFRDYKVQTKKPLFYFSNAFYLFLFLSIGDRGPALSLGIAIIALYSHYVKSPKPYLIPPLIISGMLIMSIVGSGRKIEGNSDNIFTKGLKEFSFDLDGFYQSTFDLTGNAWTLYTGYTYTQINGINWGSTIVSYLLSVIPFAQGFIESTFNLRFTSSSLLFTEIGLGPDATWGLGTNLISSVYIAFGLVGVITAFFLLGYITEKARKRLYFHNTIWVNIMYFTLVSLAIYYPRAEILTPLKTIIWTYMIYILLRNARILKVKHSINGMK